MSASFADPFAGALVDRYARWQLHAQGQQLSILAQKVAHMANEQADFAAALAKLTSAVSAGVAEMKLETQKIVDLIASAPAGIDPQAFAAAATQLNALADNLNAGVAAANAALPPAAPAAAPAAAS